MSLQNFQNFTQNQPIQNYSLASSKPYNPFISKTPDMSNKANELFNNSMQTNYQEDSFKPNIDRSDTSMEDYYKRTAGVESKGDYNAYNKGSGAFGKFQFIPSTADAYRKRLGFSEQQARTPQGQDAMMRAFTNDNRRSLIARGYEPTQRNLYLAHNLGIGSALSYLGGGNVKLKYLQGQGVNSMDEWNQKFSKYFN